MLLDAVEGLEQGHDVALVRLLGGGEAALVDAVVDQVVGPLAGLVNVLAQGLGVQVEVAGGAALGQLRVEGAAQHAQDLGALVADNGLGDLVVQHGDREARGVVLVDAEVEVAQVGEALVQGVGDDVLTFGVGVFGGREAPAYISIELLVYLGSLSQDTDLAAVDKYAPFSPMCQCTTE